MVYTTMDMNTIPKGIAWERLSFQERYEKSNWLTKNFGPSNKDTWYIEIDYDLENMIFSDEIAMMYYLRWM
jgi:hypothetical protein